jgi:hypothetical protein
MNQTVLDIQGFTQQNELTQLMSLLLVMWIMIAGFAFIIQGPKGVATVNSWLIKIVRRMVGRTIVTIGQTIVVFGNCIR